MRGAPPPDAFDEPILSKATVQVALVMSLMVVLGVFGVCVVLKLNGYGLSTTGYLKWNTVAVFVRHHGFHLLWVPVLWTFVAVVAQRRDRGQFYWCNYVVGIFLSGLMFLTFLYAAAAPYEREGIIRKIQKPRKNG